MDLRVIHLCWHGVIVVPSVLSAALLVVDGVTHHRSLLVPASAWLGLHVYFDCAFFLGVVVLG